MKVRFGFWLWLLMLPVIAITLQFKLRPFPHILLLFWTLVPLWAWIALKLASSALRIELLVPSRSIHRNRTFDVILRATNKSAFSAVQLMIPDENIPSLLVPRKGRAERILRAKAFHIGHYPLPDRSIYLEDAFGLFLMPAKVEASPALILPDLQNAEIPVAESTSTKPVKSTRRTGQDEVSHIEPYLPGTPMRKIHWKLSARMQEWMMRHYDEESDVQVTLVVLAPQAHDDRALEAKDALYDLAFSLAYQALANSITVQLFRSQKGNVVPIASARYAGVELALDSVTSETARHSLAQFHDPQANLWVLAEHISPEDEAMLLRFKSHGNEMWIFSLRDELTESQRAVFRKKGIGITTLKEDRYEPKHS